MKQPKTPQHPVTYDIPLPGHFPCLTLQLNVTRYTAGAMGRMVLVVREPSAGVEVHREFIEVEPWEQVHASISHAVAEAMKIMVYLQDGDKSS